MMYNKHESLYRSPGSYIIDFYEKINYPMQKPLWLNLGLWRSGDTYHSACESLTNWVINASKFKQNDSVLDAGSGFCQPAVYMAKKNPHIKIHSINIRDDQIEIAKMRISKLQLNKIITISKCSATALHFTDNSFDVIFALESAFHFNTREKFLQEAYRVLKPKGRLIMADMLSGNDLNPQKKIIENYGIPIDNLIDINIFKNQLNQKNFKIEQLISIREQVYPFAAKLSKKLSIGANLYTSKIYLSKIEQQSLLGIHLWENIGLNDFILMCAEKR